MASHFLTDLTVSARDATKAGARSPKLTDTPPQGDTADTAGRLAAEGFGQLVKAMAPDQSTLLAPEVVQPVPDIAPPVSEAEGQPTPEAEPVEVAPEELRLGELPSSTHMPSAMVPVTEAPVDAQHEAAAAVSVAVPETILPTETADNPVEVTAPAAPTKETSDSVPALTQEIVGGPQPKLSEAVQSAGFEGEVSTVSSETPQVDKSAETSAPQPDTPVRGEPLQVKAERSEAGPDALRAREMGETAAPDQMLLPVEPRSRSSEAETSEQALPTPAVAASEQAARTPQWSPIPASNEVRPATQVPPTATPEAPADRFAQSGPVQAPAPTPAVASQSPSVTPAPPAVEVPGGGSSIAEVVVSRGPDLVVTDRPLPMVQAGPAQALVERPIAAPNLQATAVQIGEVVLKQPNGPVEIALNPEDLGRLRMVVSQNDLGLRLIISAERTETLDMLRRNIDQLSDDLRRLGYGDASFEFSGQFNRGSERQETLAARIMEQRGSPIGGEAISGPTRTITHAPSAPFADNGLDMRF